MSPVVFLCWMCGKRGRGWGWRVAVGGIAWEGESRVDMSTASHVVSGCDVMEIRASSFRAAAQRAAELAKRVVRSFLREAESEVEIKGWRVERMCWTEESSCSGVWLPRVRMPRRVRTLQTLSLRPPEAERDVEMSSRTWLTAWWFGRLSCGKGCQMESQRQVEMMCSTFRSLRNSETGDGQMGVAAKTGLSLHSSS